MRERILLLFLFCSSTFLWAAESTPAKASTGISWHNFSSSASFDYFENKSVSISWLWPKSAARLHLTFRQLPFTDEKIVSTIPFKEKMFGHVGVEYLYLCNVVENVKLHFGGGPALHIVRKKDGKENKDLFDAYTFGPAMSVVCGLNYFLSNNVAVRAEYSTIIQFGMDVFGWYEMNTDDFSGIYYYSGQTSFIESFPSIGFFFNL